MIYWTWNAYKDENHTLTSISKRQSRVLSSQWTCKFSMRSCSIYKPTLYDIRIHYGALMRKVDISITSNDAFLQIISYLFSPNFWNEWFIKHKLSLESLNQKVFVWLVLKFTLKSLNSSFLLLHSRYTDKKFSYH